MLLFCMQLNINESQTEFANQPDQTIFDRVMPLFDLKFEYFAFVPTFLHLKSEMSELLPLF